MKQPVVSIICNVYNHEKYLRETLEGFVMQKTNFVFDILIHDDASTDASADIIREYEAKYPDLFKPIYQSENQYSKIKAISVHFQEPRTVSKYVAICEGDDCWTDPLKLQKQYDFMEAHPEYTLCTCSTQWYNMLNGTIEDKGCIDEDMDIPLEDIILEKNGRIFQMASYFVKTEIWKDRPNWRKSFPIGDLPLAIMAGIHGKVHMLADKMTIYRYYSQGSWTARMDSEKHRIAILNKMINAFNLLNEETNYQYDETIQLRIKRHKYALALMTHDLRALTSDELKDMFKARSFAMKTSDLLRCTFPKLHRVIMNTLKRSTLNIK